MKDLQVAGVTKSFGQTVALSEVNLAFFPGEVHAVLGENGAGKSTLVSIISGFIRPDRGSILLGEEPIPLGQPQISRKLGIAMVHQHFTLAPGLTATENYALGHQSRLFTSWNPAKVAQELKQRSHELGWDLDPKVRVSEMGVGMQQRLEILKNIGEESQVLIFDEPTAVLTPSESAELLSSLRQFAAQGKIVILIAHKLGEVLSVADRISVLRKGKVVGEMNRTEATEPGLAALMLGEVPQFSRLKAETPRSDGLVIKGLSVRGDMKNLAIDGLDLDVKRGEIVGIGGVDGNGQTELAEAVIGIRHPRSGSVHFAGNQNPNIAYIPGDRQREGLALEMTLWENFAIGKKSGAGFHRGQLKVSEVRKWANGLLSEYEVKAPSELEIASSLSGGNQQKVVVGRELDRKPELIVATNPTRGLDIKASQFVRDALRKAKEGGAAVLLISTDLEELAEAADRVYFLTGGKLSSEADVKAMVGV